MAAVTESERGEDGRNREQKPVGKSAQMVLLLLLNA